MKKVFILLFLAQLSVAQITFDSTWYYEQAMWDSISKAIERAERTRHTHYYTLTGVNIPKVFNEVIIEMVYNKPRKIYIQSANN